MAILAANLPVIRNRIPAMFDASEEPFRPRAIARRSCRLRDGHQIFCAGKQKSIAIIVTWDPSGSLMTDTRNTQDPPQAEGAVRVAGAVDEIELRLEPVAPGRKRNGTVKLPVPVCKSGEKVSPIPCRAPPPLGREITWLDTLDLLLTAPP